MFSNVVYRYSWKYSAYLILELTEQVARDAVNHYRGDVALNERAHIADKLICYVGAVFIHPLAGNELLVIRDLMHIFYFCSALVRIVGRTTIFPESPSSAALTAAPPT